MIQQSLIYLVPWIKDTQLSCHYFIHKLNVNAHNEYNMIQLSLIYLVHWIKDTLIIQHDPTWSNNLSSTLFLESKTPN
jgi:hypothetical protein